MFINRRSYNIQLYQKGYRRILNHRQHKIIYGSILLLLFAFCIAGCAGGMTIKTRYQPFHPADNTSIDFTVNAEDSDGISKANLYVYEYELYVNNGMQSAKQRTGGTWGLIKTWTFSSNPTTIDETYTVSGYPAGSYITYTFIVYDTKNNTRDESWTFAAGTWPFGNSPIPILGNGAPAERVDICFIADNVDYTNARDMLADLVSLVFDGYHINNAIENNRRYVQFYYSPDLGYISDYDDSPRTMTIPASVQNSPIIDHGVVIHTTSRRDWASGDYFGTEPVNIGTAVHELGHAAFGLADEYPGGGHFTSSDPHHNNYNSQTDCENYNNANGWPQTDCENIVGSWWRPEPSSSDCIMLDDGDATMPDFERTCIRRTIWFFGELED